MSLSKRNRKKLRLLTDYLRRKNVDVALLTEVTETDEGIIWITHKKEKVCVVHGKKSAIWMRGPWVEMW